MQGHEDRTRQVSSAQCEQGPAEGQAEHRDREAAGYNGQQHEVRAEPDGEQIERGSMPLSEWNGSDGAALQRCGSAAHGAYSNAATREK